MKKKLILGIATIAALSVGVGNVLMYLSDAEQVRNRLLAGCNDISLIETFEKPEPGKKTQKEPVVINAKEDGSCEHHVNCYVRGRVYFSDSRAEPYVTFYSSDKEGYNLENWVDGEDGWLYYDDILEKGAATEPMFTHIELQKEIPKEYKGFTIDVYVESVQAEGFDCAKAAFSAIG